MHEGHGNMLRLRPLTEQAAGSLLQARLGRQVPAAARRRAFELSAGNPLLLEQLAVAVGKGTDVPAAADISLAASGQGVLLSRFAGLADAGMRFAQAAAVLGSGFLPAVAAEVAGFEGTDADAAIEALARAGLIKQRPGSAVEFVHPLFRQALYDDVPGPVRCRLHARAFAALHARGLDGQAAEHAVQGALSGSPEAVTVLEAAGRAARRAGAMATAVRWLDKAAAMAGGRASVRLIMDRAEAHLVTGGAGTAVGAYQTTQCHGIDVWGNRFQLEDSHGALAQHHRRHTHPRYPVCQARMGSRDRTKRRPGGAGGLLGIPSLQATGPGTSAADADERRDVRSL